MSVVYGLVANGTVNQLPVPLVLVTLTVVVPVAVTVYGPPDVVSPPILLATSNSKLTYKFKMPPAKVDKHNLFTVANVALISLSIKLVTTPV